MHPYNFGASWNILMKLFQATWHKAGVITCVQFSEGPPLNLGGQKTSSSIRHSRHAWFWDTVFVVICQRLLQRQDFRLSKLTLHSDLRRRAASRLALPCTSSFLFFRYAFSEFPLPIALKLCHQIGICVYFIIQVQKFGGSPPKKFGAKNMQNFRRFYTTSHFDREYLRNASRYPKSEN